MPKPMRKQLFCPISKNPDDDVLRKVRGDFDIKGVDRSDQRIREQMDALIPVAREQIAKES